MIEQPFYIFITFYEKILVIGSFFVCMCALSGSKTEKGLKEF